MNKTNNYAALKKFCLAQGAQLFGVADITEVKKEFLLPEKTLAKLDNAVCLGVRLSGLVLEGIEDFPTRLYFHNYKTVNTSLEMLALKVFQYIQAKGYLALPVPVSQILDWKKQNAHLSHKKIGYLAGLGWIGRNNLLVNKQFGSQVRLVTILTNFPLKIDKPAKDSCDCCVRCISSCPAGAIKENPVDFEHLKCFEKLKEFHRQRLSEQYICGICVNACVSNSG